MVDITWHPQDGEYVATDDGWPGLSGVGASPALAMRELATALAATASTLRADVEKLREALGHYTDATYVASWGDQELADDGAVAREALGLPEPTPAELRKILGEPEPINPDFDEWLAEMRGETPAQDEEE